VDNVETARRRRWIGLCADCVYSRQVESSNHSIFYLCQRSASDPQFRKYPQLPVVECWGYLQREPDAS
jgi:hypothetical protein